MKKVISLALAVLMLISLLPVSAMAGSVDLELGTTDCDYYNLIEKTDYDLAPGAVESQFVLNDATGSRRQVVHVIEVDTKNPNISVMPGVKNISSDVDYSDSENWGSLTVTDHAAHAENNLGKNVIGGMNVSLTWSYTHPYGLVMYEGKVLHDSRSSCDVCGSAASGHAGGGYLAIKKDGTAELRDPLAPVEEDDWMAQTICFSYLVRNGVNQHPSEDHTGEGAPRSVIGVKADGTLVLMMVDGRMLPYSEGFTNHEMAETMIALGCVDAINCDGGGSSTFMTEREGSGELSVKSRFSDGSERQTLTAILVCSTAIADGVFDHAAIEAENKLVTPGSTVKFKATGTDASGSPAEIPADVAWQLADPSMGTIEDGVFVSNGTVGTATAQMVYGGEIVGEASVDVVIPESISFVQTNITAPYSKSVELDIIAKYGYNEVALKDGDISFDLSNDAVGTISGTTFTATGDTTVSDPATVTATLVHNTELTAQATITLGRASEIVYDFESGAESISDWYLSYKENYKPESYYFNDQLSVVSAEEGKVKNGNYALMVTADGDSITCMNWCQTRINGMNIDLTDAVSLSCWIYIPEGSHGYEWDFGNAIPVELGHEFKYGTGWQYFTMSVEDIAAGTNLNQLRLYHSDTNNTGIGYKHNEHPNYYADAVYYIDDITVNYSTAVDDNQAPELTDVKISYEGIDSAEAITGQTIKTNAVAFTAKAADSYSGLDVASVAVYVDGVKVEAACSDTGMISTSDIVLANGGHTVRFEISDKQGNTNPFFEYYFVLTGESTQNTINYVPADPTLENVGEGSLVWMNLEATAIESVEKVTVVIDLDQNSKWELDHMELADGFAATYTIDPENNDATITITCDGDVTAAGEAVLASMPIRVWTPAFRETGGNEDANNYRLISVMSHVEKGVLTETDGTTTTFASLEQVTSTEWNRTRLTSTSDKTEWHIHTAEALADQPATCTKAGYTGRTFCEGCNSVVEWGTTVPATGHSYDFVDGVLKCTCGELFTGVHTDGKAYVDGVVISDGWVGDSYYRDGVILTGIQKVEDYYYNFGEDGVCANKIKYSGLLKDGDVYRYSYLGVLSSGWQTVNNEWYYFHSSTMAAASGHVKVGGVYYDFEETGRLTDGVWVNAFNGWRYYYGPTYHDRWWKIIDGEQYYFIDGYRVTGFQLCRSQETGGIAKWYEFDENGVCLGTTDGVHEVNGTYYYTEDGLALEKYLVKVGDDYYYANYQGKLSVNSTVNAIATNCDLPKGTYTFGPDGKMVGTDPNGEIVTINDTLYYYESGKGVEKYLVEVGGDYYFAGYNGKLTVNSTINAFATNCDMPRGTYTFGADGKMVGASADGEIVEIDGVMYYYKNGVGVEDGLVKVDGDYYFAGYKGKLITGQVYSTYMTNCDLPNGRYEFGAEGKMLSGIVEKDGVLYYYENGVGVEKGLFELDGDYYFAQYKGKLVTNQIYGTYLTNCDLRNGRYEFGADGKMLNGIVEKDGVLYYYENGAGVEKGLFELDGEYYFALYKGKLVTNQVFGTYMTNCDLPNGRYEFGADGKMVDGVVEIDGVLYYYENGSGVEKGLFELDGNYYFAMYKGQLVTDQAVNAYLTNCDLPKGRYEFGSDGKMLDGIVEKDGTLYYYENGVGAEKGLFYLDGYYYFSEYKGKLVVSGDFNVYAGNGLLAEGVYTFNDRGQIIG